MNLIETYNTKKYDTDKDSVHSYITHLYNDLFSSKQNIKNLLEIGIANGGSILLWRDYFIDAQIDCIDLRNKCKRFLDTDRINPIIGNAYSKDIFCHLSYYDIIIDDGPHTIESMIFVIENYLSRLKNNGMCVIEDIQEYRWLNELINFIPKNFTYKIIDLRDKKNRYDDLVLIIEK